MKQTISNRQGKQLAVYTDCLKDAPVLVFSNSLGTDHGMWQSQLNELKSHFNVITYDTRGHGESDVISDTTLQNLAEDVVDILDALNIEKAHFAAFQWAELQGCGWVFIIQIVLIALQLRTQQPKLVKPRLG